MQISNFVSQILILVIHLVSSPCSDKAKVVKVPEKKENLFAKFKSGLVTKLQFEGTKYT